MFDPEYFQNVLARDVDAMGNDPIVEVHLVSGQAHRIRAVVEVGAGYVTLEAYLSKADLAHHRPRFGQADDGTPHDLFRVVVSYDSISAVVLDRARPSEHARAGFASQ